MQGLCNNLISKFKDLVAREDDIHEHVGNFRRDENYKKGFNRYTRKKMSQMKNSFDSLSTDNIQLRKQSVNLKIDH